MVLETPSEDFARGEADTVKARGQPLVCNGKARPRKAYDRQKILATPMAGIPGGERLGRDTRFVKSIARSPSPRVSTETADEGWHSLDTASRSEVRAWPFRREDGRSWTTGSSDAFPARG